MAFKVFRKKWQKITAIVLAVFIALILLLALPVNSYWSPILAREVKKIVLKSSDSLYKVDFTSAELHVLRGTIDIYNITLKPDTAVYNRRKKENIAPNNLVMMSVKRLTLSHIHPFKWYFRHQLDIGEIALDEPVLNISYQLNHKKDTVLAHRQTAWQKISKSLQSLHIDNILLGDVKLKYEDYSGNKLVISELKQLNLSAHDLLIDSATQTDKSRMLYCKNVVAELNNYSAKTPDGLYSYKFDHLRLSTLQSRLNIEGLTLTPIKTAAFFAKSDDDKFGFRLDSLQMDNFDYLSYHKYRVITASRLFLNNGRLEVYGNPKKIPRLTDRVITFPNAALNKINSDLKIDTLKLCGISVFYTEFNAKSNQTGTISFNNTGGSFLNITTRPAALQKNNLCKVDLNSLFMNQARFNVSFVFNLTDQDRSYSYKGSLGPMNLKAINPATMPLTLVKIQTGTLRRMDFDISANRSIARGKMLFLYNDAKVTLLKRDSLFNSLQSSPIATLYANNFILKHDNPDEAGGRPREIHFANARTSETPFFKYTWQTLLEGIKPSIGLDKKTRDATLALINQLSEDKRERQAKKQQRRQRRAERQLLRQQEKQEGGN
ncbi:MAG TPA: hypothetical protein VFE53_04655 [Mucilaginibacter sp.]|jgi:hypothetical protein|nr:hypothetical protein [Mucilaginibacter sp.]